MQFCSVEMGSFYLDIIKDRQYTAKSDSVARRSCQTALYHIIEALVRWMAPLCRSPQMRFGHSYRVSVRNLFHSRMVHRFIGLEASGNLK